MGLRILKLGWEFPPHNYGGLGVACEGLTRAIIEQGHSILLVLPRKQSISIDRCKLLSTDMVPSVDTIYVDSLLQPYCTSQEYSREYNADGDSLQLYGPNMLAEVERYTQIVDHLSGRHRFDIIHAHDWMSFMAGIRAKKRTGRPLVVHVHATEFDRTGGNNVNGRVYEIEKKGMEQADKVITVSNYSRNILVKRYGIARDKIAVVRNGISKSASSFHKKQRHVKKMVLFLGRLTLQKGPDYFIQVAQRVLEHRSDVRFVIAGSGDMLPRLLAWVSRAGLHDHVAFTGYVRGHEVDRVYRLADVYVMPSVSEPFGITALEAMHNGAPVIVSKQSGVSEVVQHVLKVDFWDIDEMVNKVVALLDYREMHDELTKNGHQEVQHLTWHEPARKCVALYRACLV